MQLPAVQEGPSMPEAVLLLQHGSWERTRRAPRPQLDGGDAHRAMLPDHARYPPQGRAARVRCTTKSIAKNSTTGALPPAVPLAITPTFSPWTHTSDDSYIYQLSLVLATAIVSFSEGDVDGAWCDFVRRCRLCFAQYGQEERVGGGCDVCRGACFVAVQDAEVCDSLDCSGGVCGYVGHEEGDFVFETGLVFHVAEG